MPLAFLATWAHCWLMFSQASTNTLGSFSSAKDMDPPQEDMDYSKLRIFSDPHSVLLMVNHELRVKGCSLAVVFIQK